MVSKWYYFPVGQIEVGRNYRWAQGYSRVMPDGCTVYPWLTKRQAQAAAKRGGAKAIFCSSRELALAALSDVARG